MNKLICYTDGSCRPNPGVGGIGIHCYLTDDSKTKAIDGKYIATNIGYMEKTLFKKSKDDVKEVGIKKVIDIYGYDREKDTNNKAEIYAIIKTLLSFKNLKGVDKDFETVNEVLILSDSSYSLLVLKKILDNDDMSTLSANLDLVEELKNIVNELKNSGVNISFRKVLGHSGNFGNDRADLLSNMGRVLNNRTDSSVKKLFKTVMKNRKEYYDIAPERNFLLHSKVLFNYTTELPETYNMVNYSGNNSAYKDETEVGKRGNDINYVVAKTKERDKDLDNIIDSLNKHVKSLVVPYVVFLDNLFNKAVFRNLQLYGHDYFDIKTDPFSSVIVTVKTTDDTEIAKSVYPPALTYLASLRHFELIEHLNNWIDKNLAKNISYKDITDIFYELDKKDKLVFKKDIKNDHHKFDIEHRGEKIRLHVGLDTLKRNQLKKLEKHNPKVYIVFEDYDKMFKYYCIVESDLGVAIVTNPYTNKKYIPES